MYSPKIPERFIPILYRLGRERGRPMTHLVAEAIERYLAETASIEIDDRRRVIHMDGNERRAA